MLTKKAAPAQEIVARQGEEWIIAQLEQGKGYRAIGQELGVSAMAVSRWLSSDPLRYARAIDAIKAGAEMYEQRAIDILEDAREEIREHPQISSAIVSLARERAQAAWRQAGLRDRSKYEADKHTKVDVTINHDPRNISTAQLEQLAQSALTIDNDTGEVSGD